MGSVIHTVDFPIPHMESKIVELCIEEVTRKGQMEESCFCFYYDVLIELKTRAGNMAGLTVWQIVEVNGIWIRVGICHEVNIFV